MNGLLFLLCCMLLRGAAADLTSSQNPATTAQKGDSTSHAPFQTDTTRDASSMSATLSPTTVSQTSNSHSTSRSPGPQPTTTSTSTTTTTTPIDMYYRKECLPVFLVAGGLIIACIILLLSTLLLMCKVCQLSNRVKMLSDNSDLISTSEYWIGTAKKSKSAPETEAKETTVLMADINQAQEDVGNGAAKEEAVKVKEDGQTGEEDKKEVGNTAKSEEASTTPVTIVENASSSKLQEKATDS
ncbi:uncharacterized protein [Cebidichthys violaceus]|uniref:uncharacterized protein n=1 Tax=Cebidichthys violaceus TaxID=271503 RepID=UPI0035C9BA6E